MGVNYTERLAAQRELDESQMLQDYKESIRLATAALEKNINDLADAAPEDATKIQTKIELWKTIIKELKHTVKYLGSYYVPKYSCNSKINNSKTSAFTVTETPKKYDVSVRTIINEYQQGVFD